MTKEKSLMHKNFLNMSTHTDYEDREKDDHDIKFWTPPLKSRKYEVDEYILDDSIIKKKSRHLARERELYKQELMIFKNEKGLNRNMQRQQDKYLKHVKKMFSGIKENNLH
mmetsp:Transcript_12791/g.12694  ORF Transcript_12791/g.12694 Transcript_12791/m.12694 type:complete len:111 (+) Transcript_12791:829-1161(+)